MLPWRRSRRDSGALLSRLRLLVYSDLWQPSGLGDKGTRLDGELSGELSLTLSPGPWGRFPFIHASVACCHHSCTCHPLTSETYQVGTCFNSCDAVSMSRKWVKTASQPRVVREGFTREVTSELKPGTVRFGDVEVFGHRQSLSSFPQDRGKGAPRCSC